MKWTRVDGGYMAGIYRVRRGPASEPKGWRLEVAVDKGRTGRTWVIDSIQRTRREAVARAEELERGRARHARIGGHLVVGLLASVVFVAAASSMDSLGAFVVAMLAMFVGLRSFVSAVTVRFEDAWHWQRDDGAKRVSWTDRVVAGLLSARGHSPAEGYEPSAVRVLPPNPGR